MTTTNNTTNTNNTNKPIVILISGSGPGAGKTTFAAMLNSIIGLDATIKSFAAPLKALCIREFGWNGIKDAKGRLLLQEVGCAARHHNPNHWVEIAVRECLMDIAHRVIIFDDVRFANEASCFEEAGFLTIQVHIVSTKAEASKHESEGYVPEAPFELIENDGRDRRALEDRAQDLANYIVEAGCTCDPVCPIEHVPGVGYGPICKL